MGCSHNPVRLHRLAISVLFLLISSSSQLRIFNGAEGRKLVQRIVNFQTVSEEKAILRAQIGSRPPRCERRCNSCAQCEAIQVPTNPQTGNGMKNNSTIGYARTDDDSNYKPMSWKCKCGNLIFNP